MFNDFFNKYPEKKKLDYKKNGSYFDYDEIVDLREKFQIQSVGTLQTAFFVVNICHSQHLSSRAYISVKIKFST